MSVGLQRQRELLGVERRAEAPVAVGVAGRAPSRGTSGTRASAATASARAFSPAASASTNSLTSVSKNSMPPLLSLIGLLEHRPWPGGACRCAARPARLREEARQRLELRDHRPCVAPASGAKSPWMMSERRPATISRGS